MYFQYGETEINYLKRKDKKLAWAVEQIGHIERKLDANLFAAVVRHIVGQQISSKAQATVWARLEARLKVVTPFTVHAASAEELQGLGMSLRKAEYIKDALIEDNMGRKPWNEPILADAPAAYFATIPVHEIVRSLRAQKLPVQLEFASGGYVCNEIFYRAAHAYAGTTTKVGFVHVPLLPEMVFDESLARPLEETSAILKAIIECL